MAYKYSFGSEKILTKKDGKMKDTLESDGTVEVDRALNSSIIVS